MVTKTGWTPSSWECFKNNCNCSRDCKNYEICNYIKASSGVDTPPIKKVVEDLIERDIVIPIAVTDYSLSFATNDTVSILKLWLLDNLNYEEISKKTEVTVRGVKERMLAIMQKYENNLDYPVNRSKRYSNKAQLFRAWATRNLKDEILELEKVGILCTQK